MAEKLRLRSNGNGDIYLYVEDVTNASFAAGGDSTNTVFAMNTSASSDVMPDGPTANLTFGPGANGDITVRPHGTGDSYFDTGDINLVAGNLNLPNSNSGLTEGVITFGGDRIITKPSAAASIFVGLDAGNGSGSGTLNVGMGSNSLKKVTTGNSNTATGHSTLGQLTTGIGNVALGREALSTTIDSDYNVAVGHGALLLVDGAASVENIGIGRDAGSVLTTGDSNIYLSHVGVAVESNTIRIGTQGSGDGQQNKAFIAGIHSVTPAGATQVVVIDASGQMGSGPSSGGASDFVTDSGTATDVAGVINVLGNTEEIATSGAGSTVTYGTTTNFSATGNHAWDGGIIEPASVSASSDGATITFSVEADGGGDLDVVFSDGYYLWDTTPAATIALTPGADTAPTLNYVYFLQSTKTLTVSTVSWPATEHAPLATVLCPTAALYQTNGAYAFHGWTDHVVEANQEGHMHDINLWIRQQHATWNSGVAPTLTITPNGGAADNVIFTSLAGVVLQLHMHAFPAFAGTPDVYVVNDSVTPYTIVTDLNALLTDSTGASMSGKYFTLVIWGVVNESTGDAKLMCNLPGGSYNNQAGLDADTSKFADYSIPSNFTGTGFLIYQMNLRHQAAASGTWTSIENIDLRGFFPNLAAGGSTSATTEFADNVFRIYDDADPTKLIALEASSITTANTRTITMADRDVSLITPTFDSMTADVGDVTVSVGNVAITSGLVSMPVTDATIVEGAITLGAAPFLHARGTDNAFLGIGAGNATFTVSGSEDNVIIGDEAFVVMATNCRNNVVIGSNAMKAATDSRSTIAIGFNSLLVMTTQLANVAIGSSSMDSATTGAGFNTALGSGTLDTITTGAYNCALGNGAGNALTVADSDNICIMNAGVAADVNTIRLGTQGTGNGQQDTTFIAGIYNVAATNDGMVIISSAGQLGSQLNMVMAENAAFLAYNSADDVDQTGNGAVATVDFDTEVFDQGGDFSADTFTAPVTARYQLSAGVSVNDFTAAALINITLVTGNRTYLGTQIDPTAAKDSAGAIFLQISVLADMDASDTATIAVTATGEVGDTNDIMGSASPHETYFSGYLAT